MDLLKGFYLANSARALGCLALIKLVFFLRFVNLKMMIFKAFIFEFENIYTAWMYVSKKTISNSALTYLKKFKVSFPS